MSLSIQNSQKIVFIGDSITDAQRREGFGPLGNGYVRFFHDLALLREPEKQLHILNRGIGGNKITDLRDRWFDDVLRESPDFLSVKVGINDLISYLVERDDAVSPAYFEEVYDGVLARMRQELPNCQLLLIEPFFLSLDPPSDVLWRGRVVQALPAYSTVVARLAQKYQARHIAMQTLFASILNRYPLDVLAPEPVHPHQTGHLLIAEAVYRALED